MKKIPKCNHKLCNSEVYKVSIATIEQVLECLVERGAVETVVRDDGKLAYKLVEGVEFE